MKTLIKKYFELERLRGCIYSRYTDDEGYIHFIRPIDLSNIEYPLYVEDRVEDIFEKANKCFISFEDNTIEFIVYETSAKHFGIEIPDIFFDDKKIKYKVWRAVDEAEREIDEIHYWNSMETEWEMMEGR